MCILAALPALGAVAGAGTAAATIGGVLQTVGTIAGVGGSLMQGIQSYQAGKAQAAALSAEKRTTGQLTAIEDGRTRARFASALRQQTAELAGRGVSLDSPTALLLAQKAGEEMSFESQAVRSRGLARGAELSASETMARGQAFSGLMRGTFSAAGGLLNAAPDLWPSLSSKRMPSWRS